MLLRSHICLALESAMLDVVHDNVADVRYQVYIHYYFAKNTHVYDLPEYLHVDFICRSVQHIFQYREYD